MCILPSSFNVELAYRSFDKIFSQKKLIYITKFQQGPGPSTCTCTCKFTESIKQINDSVQSIATNVNDKDCFGFLNMYSIVLLHLKKVDIGRARLLLLRAQI